VPCRDRNDHHGLIARRLRSLAALALVVVAGCSSASSRESATSSTTAPPEVELTTTTTTATTVPPPTTTSTTAAPPPGRPVPLFQHVVVVVLENHGASQILGNPEAPYLNELARIGASFTDAHAVTHPSEPNYLALFSGSTQGVTSDGCPVSFDGPNLGAALLDAGRTFVGYAEGLPYDGFTGCASGRYGRKHNPWVDFTNVPASSNLAFSRFPSMYGGLPDVAFVVPDICNDMHDCPVGTGDAWVQQRLGPYVDWAKEHDSLLVVTFDEDESTEGNRIVTLFAGAHVRPGDYSERIDHVRVLRTIEDAFGLPHAGTSAKVAPITDVWN
jgi:phosphatidylinositol-3-phosphatase